MRSERSKMIWAQLLAYVTGTVDQELLLRNEYLAAENRILKAVAGELQFYPPQGPCHIVATRIVWVNQPPLRFFGWTR